jgi:hypothetical protein
MLDSCSVENSRHPGGVGLYARSVPTSRYLHAQAGYRRLRKKTLGPRPSAQTGAPRRAGEVAHPRRAAGAWPRNRHSRRGGEGRQSDVIRHAAAAQRRPPPRRIAGETGVAVRATRSDTIDMHKRVAYLQAHNLVPMLHIFRIQPFRPGRLRAGENEAIPEAVAR